MIARSDASAFHQSPLYGRTDNPGLRQIDRTLVTTRGTQLPYFADIETQNGCRCLLELFAAGRRLPCEPVPLMSASGQCANVSSWHDADGRPVARGTSGLGWQAVLGFDAKSGRSKSHPPGSLPRSSNESALSASV